MALSFKSVSLTISLALLSVSCVTSSTEHIDEGRLELFEQRTYAWVDEPLAGPDGSTREDLTELTVEARSLLTAALAERGFRGVREGDAAVLMALRLDVTEETRALDPYFAQDQVERYETGHLSLALLSVSCVTSSTEHIDEGRLELLQQRTYAWVDEPLAGPEGSTREDLTKLTLEARSLLTAALAERGFTDVGEEDAAVLMALRLDVTDKTRELDPYFAQDQVERFETGHLSLAAFAPITYDEVWRARSEVKLRTTAQGLGTLRVRWKELDEERSWQLDALVSAIVERLP